MGFFEESLFIVGQPKPTREQCGACGLLGHCKTPKMAVQGRGKQRVMLVANSVDIAGDGAGITWGGDTGATLRNLVKAAGLVWEQDVWVTSALACRGTATGEKARHCRPLLLRRIKELQPTVILLLGQYALQSVVGESFDTEELGTIDEWAGLRIPSRNPDAWLFPMHDPARLYATRENNTIRKKMFEHQFATALAYRQNEPPGPGRNYADQVEIIRDHKEAAKVIRDITAAGRTTAFDYETNMLKPENPEGKIFSVSICMAGEYTVAAPFTGEVVTALAEYLRSPVPKIASNMKFEDRWTRAVFGHGVAGWAWDTMLMAHILDTRKSFCSIKRQAFVHLGWPLYNRHIHPFFEAAASPNHPNEIHKIAVDQLFEYNGIDSAVEYDVAMIQMQHLEHPLYEELPK